MGGLLYLKQPKKMSCNMHPFSLIFENQQRFKFCGKL